MRWEEQGLTYILYSYSFLGSQKLKVLILKLDLYLLIKRQSLDYKHQQMIDINIYRNKT